MQRQGNTLTGTLAFILGLALLFCCCLHSEEVGAEPAESGTLQGAGGADVQTPAEVGAGGSESANDAEGNKPAKALKKTKASKPASKQEKTAEEIGVPSAATKQYTGKTVSLDLMDADLRNVLRLLSDLTNTNIVVEPDVTGKVTLKVQDVPWLQVLDMVLSMNDLGKEQVGNVIRIAKQSKLRQEYVQQAEAIKAKQNLAETTRDLGELTTIYFPVNFGKPSEVAAKITEGKSERGKVSVDERTSLIIYTDYPARVAYARQLLARLDRPTPQVLIEARIITLSSENQRTLGANLQFSTQYPTTATGNAQGFQINPATAAFPNQFGAIVAQLVGKTLVSVDLQIQALQTVSQTRVVAAPRILTLDNVKAIVSSGQEIPYLQVGDTAANVTATAFKDVLLELAVTPHITPDRKVRMLINAKQDTVSTTIYNVGNSGEPAIDTNKIQTELLVDDGNVIVIGGVIDNTSTMNKSSTPGLSDIPILGRLFRTDTTDDKRNELLIFISPKIVEVSKPYDKN